MCESIWSIVKYSGFGLLTTEIATSTQSTQTKRQIYIILRISSCLSTSLLFLSDVAKDRWTATQTWHYFKMNLSTLPQVSNVCLCVCVSPSSMAMGWWCCLVDVCLLAMVVECPDANTRSIDSEPLFSFYIFIFIFP